VGAAGGKLDAVLFMAGLVLGIWAFAEVYPEIASFAWSGGIGVRTLGDLSGLPVWAVAAAVVIMAVALFRLASLAEKHLSQKF
jgi:uncharacterized protein